MAKKPERSASALRTAVLVLGMHRSGTSALARIVNFLGAAMPRHLIPATTSNPRGHWESAALVALHDQLLAALDSSWDDWRTPGARWKESDAASRFAGPIRMTIDEEYGNAPLLVVKDPRMCRTLPYWMSILEKSGIRSAPLIIVRNPLEVAESLRLRDGISFEKAMLLWLRHNLDAEYETRHLQRNIVTYDALLEDWKLLAVQTSARLGINWSRQPTDAASDVREFLDIELHNQRASQAELETHTEVPYWVKAAYRSLIQLCDEPKAAEPKRELDKVRHGFAESAKTFGGVAFAQTEALRQAAVDVAAANLRADVADALRADLARERAATAELTALRDKLTARTRELEGAHSAATSRAAQFERKNQEFEASLAKLPTDAAELKTLAKRLSERTEWIEGELKKRHGENEKMKAQLQEARDKALSMSSDLMTATKDVHVHEKRAIKAEAEGRHNKESLAAARSRLAVLEAEERAAQAEITELRAELAEMWSLTDGPRASPRALPPPSATDAQLVEATGSPAETTPRAKRIEDDLRYERMHVQQLERRLSTWMGLASAALRKITRLGRRPGPRRRPAEPARIAASR